MLSPNMCEPIIHRRMRSIWDTSARTSCFRSLSTRSIRSLLTSSWLERSRDRIQTYKFGESQVPKYSLVCDDNPGYLEHVSGLANQYASSSASSVERSFAGGKGEASLWRFSRPDIVIYLSLMWLGPLPRLLGLMSRYQDEKHLVSHEQSCLPSLYANTFRHQCRTWTCHQLPTTPY